MFQWNNNNNNKNPGCILLHLSLCFLLENTLLLSLYNGNQVEINMAILIQSNSYSICFHCLLFLFGTGTIDWCQRSWIHVYQLTATELCRGGNTKQCLHELDKKSGWLNFSLNGVLEELTHFLEHGMLSGESGLDLISVITFFISRNDWATSFVEEAFFFLKYSYNEVLHISNLIVRKSSLYSQDFAVTINYGRTEQPDVKVEESWPRDTFVTWEL